MATTITDLWPDDIAVTNLVPPVVILKQQAELLGQKTNNLVEGQVETAPLPPTEGFTFRRGFQHNFYLVAPALGHYKYRLFSMNHQVEPYPVTIESGSSPVEAANEEELKDALRKIFSSEETKRIIHSLLAQSRA